MFKFSDDMNVSVSLKVGTTLLFLGQYVTHQQSCTTTDKDKQDLFYNFASYGNARLFRHIHQSFIRVKGDKQMKQL